MPQNNITEGQGNTIKTIVGGLIDILVAVTGGKGKNSK